MVENRTEPNDDELAGMHWWNSLSESDRAKWLKIADSAKASDAWLAYKKSRKPG